MLTAEKRAQYAKSYGVGTKAYVDSFGGMIRCTVIAVHKPAALGFQVGSVDEISVCMDETRGGYTQGEIVQRSAAYTPPCTQMFVRDYSYRINTGYKYVAK